MDSEQLLYPTGEEVHAGDRVQYRDTFATVVFATDGETSEFSPGYEGYAGYDRAVIICDDDGTLNNLNETDEQLVFVSRA
jgi:hypothetical protein